MDYKYPGPFALLVPKLALGAESSSGGEAMAAAGRLLQDGHIAVHDALTAIGE